MLHSTLTPAGMRPGSTKVSSCHPFTDLKRHSRRLTPPSALMPQLQTRGCSREPYFLNSDGLKRHSRHSKGQQFLHRTIPLHGSERERPVLNSRNRKTRLSALTTCLHLMKRVPRPG